MKLAKDDFANDVFCDQLLRRLADIPLNSKLTIDISDCSWLTDFQLSFLPFALSHLKENKNILITVEYPADDLFKEDSQLDYLYASGFFTFLESAGIRTQKYAPLRGYKSEDPLVKFQSFRNIAHVVSDAHDIESRRLLYELQSSLRAIFEEKILVNYAVAAERLTREIAKELIENINLHSQASLALLRFRYLQDTKDIARRYGHIPTLKNFLHSHQNSPLFVITISDNGLGIIQTLKNKYKEGTFLVNDGEALNTILSESNSWWIKRAFSSHKTASKDARTRLGLKAILDIVCEYNGFLYVKSGDANITYDKYDGGPVDLQPSLYNPTVSGTHYLLIFPAEQRKHETFADSLLYTQAGVETWSQTSSLKYIDFDISYVANVAPVSTSIEVSYKYPHKVIEVLSKELEKVIGNNDSVFVIDFANAVKERVADYAYILEKLVEKFGNKFGQYCILRNLLDDVITKLRKSKFAQALYKNKTFAIVFNVADRFSLIGIREFSVEGELLDVQRSSYLPARELKAQTIDLIEKNQRLLKLGTLSDAGKVAFFVDFNAIFTNALKEKIQTELTTSGALISGHFNISSAIHVNRYLIAPYMFHNPSLCRAFAKEVFKKVHHKKPDILVTYSTTGIILYYYLRNYYMPNLELMLVTSSQDLTTRYGTEIKHDQKVLVLIDVKCTGTFISKLSELAANLSGSSDNIVDHITIFDLYKSAEKQGFDVTSIFDDVNIDLRRPEDCTCRQTNKSYVIYRSDLSIDLTSGIPTIRQKETSNLSELIRKRDLSKGTRKLDHAPVEQQELRSRIDDDKLTGLELVEYWKSMDQAFQVEHVERGDTHFAYYDVPEELLSRKKTLFELEAYIKQFVWSFKEEVHYIVYNRDLTSALLAHIVASRFLKKPEVIEAVKYSDGSLVLPNSVSQNLDEKRVLLVDDAINTGTTMFELIGLIGIYNGIVSGIFTITNRTSPETELTLRKLVPKVACAYRFTLGTFNRAKCTLCAYRNVIEDRINNSATKDFNEYLNAKMHIMTVKQFRKS